MNGASWACWRAAQENGDRDDDPTPGRHDHEPPRAVYVCHMADSGDDFGPYPVGRWFGAESWNWPRVLAWKAAMEKRLGKGRVWIEEEF
jgi:hypothetical protein